MPQYLVTLDGASGVALFLVDADSPVSAARKVSEQGEHLPGTGYGVEPRDGSESRQEIAVDDAESRRPVLREHESRRAPDAAPAR
jgi:hypothetical protein